MSDEEKRQKFEFVDRGPSVALSAEEETAVSEIMADAEPPSRPEWEKVWSAKDGREAERHSGTGVMRFRRGPDDEWVSPADGHAPWVKEEHKQAFDKRSRKN